MPTLRRTITPTAATVPPSCPYPLPSSLSWSTHPPLRPNMRHLRTSQYPRVMATQWPLSTVAFPFTSLNSIVNSARLATSTTPSAHSLSRPKPPLMPQLSTYAYAPSLGHIPLPSRDSSPRRSRRSTENTRRSLPSTSLRNLRFLRP